jgi:hypothetical protein
VTFDSDCQQQKKEVEKLEHSVPSLHRSVTKGLDAHSKALPGANHWATYLLHRGDSSVLGFDPGHGGLMTCEYALHGRQPSLSTSQRSLSLGKAGSAFPEHHFRHSHKSGGMTGGLFDGGQRPARQRTDVIFVPNHEVIAYDQGEHAHRYPVS